jgi:hypothetical protein
MRGGRGLSFPPLGPEKTVLYDQGDGSVFTNPRSVFFCLLAPCNTGAKLTLLISSSQTSARLAFSHPTTFAPYSITPARLLGGAVWGMMIVA